jgi:hypothetical protein
VDLGGALTVDGVTTLNEDVTIAVDKSLALSGTGSLTIAGNEALDVASELIEMQNIFIDIPVVVGTRTYVLDARARYPYTIDTVYSKCKAGSGTYTLRINGTVVTDLTGKAIGTTGVEQAASAANEVVINDRVTLDFPTVTNNFVDAEMSIQFTRTTMAAS